MNGERYVVIRASMPRSTRVHCVRCGVLMGLAEDLKREGNTSIVDCHACDFPIFVWGVAE